MTNNNVTNDKHKEYRQTYYESHKDEIIVKQKEYYKENVDKLREYGKNHYRANKDEILRKQKENYRKYKEIANNPMLLEIIKSKLPTLETNYNYFITKDKKGIYVDVLKIPNVIVDKKWTEIENLKVSEGHDLIITYRQYMKNNDFKVNIPKEYLKYKPITPDEALVYLKSGKYDIVPMNDGMLYAVKKG